MACYDDEQGGKQKFYKSYLHEYDDKQGGQQKFYKSYLHEYDDKQGGQQKFYDFFFFMSMIVTMKYEIGTTDKVWAIITAHFTENWGFYTLLTR